jgi:peptide/nickel transport system substrate-binding protein
MNNVFKLISVSLLSLMISFSFANASSGTFKISHDLGFGKDTNLDAITKGRLFQVGNNDSKPFSKKRSKR